jgi:hypothetical protein
MGRPTTPDTSADPTWPRLVHPSWIRDSLTTTNRGGAADGVTFHLTTADHWANPPSPRMMTTHSQGDRLPTPPPPLRPSSCWTRGGRNDTALMLMARGPSEVYRCPSSSMYNVTSCSQKMSERTSAFSLCGTVFLPNFTSGGAMNEGGRNNVTSNDNDLLGSMSKSRTTPRSQTSCSSKSTANNNDNVNNYNDSNKAKSSSSLSSQ